MHQIKDAKHYYKIQYVFFLYHCKYSFMLCNSVVLGGFGF